MRSLAGRIWLDITGVRPGSEAAVLAAALGHAWHTTLGLDLRICRRDPSLLEIDLAALDRLVNGRDGKGRPPRLDAFRRRARRLPERTRLALGRYVRLQSAALLAWRVALQGAVRVVIPPQPRDQAHPAADDTLVMLIPSGDAARFAAAGTRLVFLAAETAALIRPDWLMPEDAAQAAIWLRLTLPHVTNVIAFTPAIALAMTQAGCVPTPMLVNAAVARPTVTVHPTGLPSRPFVLAMGEIGEAGGTRHLLLAWRHLLDTMNPGAVPLLVLAGMPGALVGDILEQLRNSQLFGGHVRLVVHPRPDELAQLYRSCLFTIAAAHSSWGHATLASLAAGVPCLSAFPTAGAEPIEPANVAGLAQKVQAWLASPPSPPAAPNRGWNDVAGDVLKALAT